MPRRFTSRHRSKHSSSAAAKRREGRCAKRRRPGQNIVRRRPLSNPETPFDQTAGSSFPVVCLKKGPRRAPFSRKVVISRKIENSRQIDGNSNCHVKFPSSFLSRFRYGESFLSAHGKKKRAAIFYAKMAARSGTISSFTLHIQLVA